MPSWLPRHGWFQFALPRGERRCASPPSPTSTGFQFALPRGERPAICRCAPPGGCFNSRSRVGSDQHQRVHPRHQRVSIRAPAWGATRSCRTCLASANVSIRAPAWGATFGGNARGDGILVSIRAPAWGATILRAMMTKMAEVSIRAPAWGATLHGSYFRA